VRVDEHPRWCNRSKLAADALDMNVNCSVAVWHSATPDTRVYVLSRNNPVGAFCQCRENLELSDGQRCAYPSDQCFSVAKAELKRAKDDRVFFEVGGSERGSGIHPAEVTPASTSSREGPVTRW